MASPQHADKRRRILQAAFEVFGELGFRKTTVQAIADRVGVTPGSLYNYFQDKDALFLASLSSVWDQLGQAAQTAIDNQQIPFVRRARDLFLQAELLLRKAHSLLTGSFSSPERRSRLRVDLDKVCALMVPFFEEGRQAGLRFVPADSDRAHFTLKLLLTGALWNLALVDGPALMAEIGRIKAAFFQELDSIPS